MARVKHKFLKGAAIILGGRACTLDSNGEVDVTKKVAAQLVTTRVWFRVEPKSRPAQSDPTLKAEPRPELLASKVATVASLRKQASEAHSSWLKAELLELAEKLGLEVSSRDSNAKLARAIRKAAKQQS